MFMIHNQRGLLCSEWCSFPNKKRHESLLPACSWEDQVVGLSGEAVLQ